MTGPRVSCAGQCDQRATWGRYCERHWREAVRRAHVPPTVTVIDRGYALVVLVDWHNGQGPHWALSTPTHAGAQYQEARDAGRAEAEARVARFVAEHVAAHGSVLA